MREVCGVHRRRVYDDVDMTNVSDQATVTLERASVDATLTQMRREVLRGSVHLTALMNAAIHVGHEFSASSEITALISLRTSGRLRARELAHRTGMTSAGTTNMIDRLERAGLVQRRPDVHDRRGVTVELLSAGIEAVDSMTDRLTEVFIDAAPRLAKWGGYFDAMGIGVGPLVLPAGNVLTRLEYVGRTTAVSPHIRPLYSEAFGDDVARPHLLLLVLLLATEPGGTRPCQVSEAALLSPASTSDLLACAEANDLITRSHGRAPDRRATIVTATEHGRAALDVVLDGSDPVMRALADTFFGS